MLMTQYFDMMKDIGSNSKTTTVFVPHTPGAVADIGSQVRDSLMHGRAADIPVPQQAGEMTRHINGHTNKIAPA